MIPRLKLNETLSSAVDVARDLRILLENKEAVVDHAQLIRRKLPSVVKGLKLLAKSDKQERLSIGVYLDQNARERPHDPAIFYEDRRYSHLEFNEQANRYANFFRAAGIKKADPVAIFVDNRPELLFAVAGAVKIGAIAAVVNTRQRKNVLAHSLKLSQARMYVVGEELYEAFAAVRAELAGAERDRVVYVPETSKPAPQDVTDAVSALEKSPRATPAEQHAVTLADPCFYIYTSGTTGLPKASIMSHYRWVKAAAAFGKLALDMRPTDVMYVALPFYHNNALTVAWGSAATAGASIVIRRKFSASQFWDDIRKYRANSFAYIGELCRYLVNQPRRPDDAANPAVKCVGNGLRPDIWKQFQERFGIDEIYEFYAASEGNVAFVNVLNLACTVGLCPAPYAIVEYDVANDEPVRGPDGRMRRVEKGGVGLLLAEVSERYSFDGYTDKAASEKKLFRDVFRPGDVWFNSGDLLRDQGFRHAQFVDRVGDTFRWKSENVSTNEVAEVINQFAQVAEATVYGVLVPNAEGRAGMAAIVSNVPVAKFDLPGLARLLCEQLPSYAVPVFVRFRPELEVTGTFKQRKGDLRDQGFDPGKINEPLYVMLPRTNEFVPLTAELFRDIERGTITL
jgi:acyl-CoA synthetase (AMP-forming)/AMP-acid ligase II